MTVNNIVLAIFFMWFFIFLSFRVIFEGQNYEYASEIPNESPKTFVFMFLERHFELYSNAISFNIFLVSVV